MIGYLKGHLLAKDEGMLLVDVSGVGYEVFVAPRIAQPFKVSSPVSLWIYNHIREDGNSLFGFTNKEEKHVFLALLKVNGIGPKMALNILSSCSLEHFTAMVRDENIKALKTLPRVGIKMAQQIVLTLKKQISDVLIGTDAKSRHLQQLTTALENLGYASLEIRQALTKIKIKEDLQEDIKQALSLLSASA